MATHTQFYTVDVNVLRHCFASLITRQQMEPVHIINVAENWVAMGVVCKIERQNHLNSWEVTFRERD